MLRYVVVLAVAVALFGTGEARAHVPVSASESAAPAAARQPCGCTIKWANYFRTHPYMQTVFEVRLSAQGVNERKAKRVTKRIKAYGRNKGFIPGELCNSPARAKACEAAIACTASAGLTYQTARAAGASRREAAWGALGACEAAVVGVYSRP